MTMLIITLCLEIIIGTSAAYLKVDAIMLMNCGILGVLKLSYFRFIHVDNLISNFSSAVNDYSTIDTEEKRTIMRRHAFMGRAICYSILGFTYFSAIIFILQGMVLGDKDVHVNVSIKNQASSGKLPVPVTFFGDLQFSTSLYFMIFAVQYFVLMILATSNCGNDTLFFAITLHICGQLELLKIEYTKYGME
ncbi:PREDICTED: uncharacterized protein LOC105461557, partial [Wasmannia auropunctata]|uniref:uncharacterized protein LOC105461557 n=1 Tax=Wasmannia auropunctata TaxID=64793 RepID=UPI0005EFBA7C